jgi:hypothetical protein
MAPAENVLKQHKACVVAPTVVPSHSRARGIVGSSLIPGVQDWVFRAADEYQQVITSAHLVFAFRRNAGSVCTVHMST